ncbi:MAG TPA: hypothetical protein PKC99_05880 [Anaerolineales bacterium]|nr:hypothetical protein [Anaerolineales bacterium]
MEGKVFVKNVEGIEIFVNEKGTFEAEINGKIEKRSSLASLVRVIKERRGGLDVQLVENLYNRKLRKPVTIIGFTGHSKAKTSDGERLQIFHGDLYLCNEDQVAAIDALIAEQDELTARWVALLNELQVVSNYTFDKIMKERAGGVE